MRSAFLVLPLALMAMTSVEAADSLDPVRQGRLLLRQGSRGSAVQGLQRALTQAGYPLTADGIFGPRTLGEVRRFQRDAGLTVDGLVGPRTVAALDSALAGSRPAPSPSPAPTPTPTPPSGQQLGRIPPRPAGALTGSAFLAHTSGLSRTRREDRILAELELGNLPDFLRTFQEVSFQATGRDGLVHTVQVWVMPDYLAIGSDQDFVRMPMGAPTAQRLADLYGCLLPTRQLVDTIYRAARVKLAPAPMTPSAAMMSNAYYGRHQATIERQWAAHPQAVRGDLTAGHKKDVVITPRLASRPDRVAIYGWHQLNGKPIQPLSTVHTKTYADYSHGVRMVFETAAVDGRAMAVADILADPVLWPLLSDEGIVADPRVPGIPGVSTPAPTAPRTGWVSLRRMTNSEVTPAITAEAVRILREHGADPYGTEIPFLADGNTYVARIEQHYHPPGGAARPWGYHKGVSVFEPVF